MHRGAMVPQFADRLSVMAALLAAIMHDYEHMGLTNDFLVNNSSMLAIRYNDRAPLENHHLAAGFTVLHSRDHNFLDGLPKAEYSRLRKIVIDLVLATDMKQHFALVGQFNAVVRRVTPRSKPQEPGPHPHDSPSSRAAAFAHFRDKPMGRALSSSLCVLMDSQSPSSRRQPAASTQRASMDVMESALSQLRAATQDASAKLEVGASARVATRCVNLGGVLLRASMDVMGWALSQVKAATQDASAKIPVNNSGRCTTRCINLGGVVFHFSIHDFNH
ncbi:hypothetical protein DUNSADRAFT_1472 [Dunaliella salina]|uniref:PDEase domain-containing protein n=1 Tax=Dunaliella salina TaxID=3046 RepID=A0ABQ7GX24_DUNSA|nr:hypothetical protein DUNSADRAFT_1472 [Dunaliella salina]|eukprot:KAF5839160.1 hypothetical protein DUNSADRAFT_1472 [Dunaliella salina]